MIASISVYTGSPRLLTISCRIIRAAVKYMIIRIMIYSIGDTPETEVERIKTVLENNQYNTTILVS
jgi:hypothetical protein